MDKPSILDRIAEWLGGWKIVNPLGILILSISAWFVSMAIRNLRRPQKREHQE